MAIKKARVLVDCAIRGVLYQSGDVISIDDKKARDYVALGVVDFEPAGVEYAESVDGGSHVAKDHAAIEAAVAPAADAAQQ